MTDADETEPGKPMPTETATLADLEDRPRVRLFDGEPRTVRLALEAGDGIPPHRHPDREIVLHLLEGRLSLALDDEEYALEAGDVARFDGTREIALDALADSVALLVLASRAE